MKILIVFGTRPEAIKMAPLVHMLRAQPSLTVTVCVTAQHRQMLDQVLGLFSIKPDIDLNLMRDNQDLFDVTSSILVAMRAVLDQHQPDIVLVHGDTTTAYATALACFYRGVTVGHVEAGLRTNDLRSPFPEEFNRQAVGKIATWHFAPTATSRQNLIDEGIPSKNILVTGNTVIDALFWVIDRIESNPTNREILESSLSVKLPFDWKKQRFVLITGHRRENFGAGFLSICQAIKHLAEKHRDVHFVYPVHLNPNVQKPVYDLISGHANIHLTAPLEYEPFVFLLKHAYLVLTDSGGIQEEAPSLGKPVLVMRDVTERPEAVSAGTVNLVGASAEKIIHGVAELLDDDSAYAKMATAHNPYGDGLACNRITQLLNTLK
jgi:UDP-N-acetylglucosamine 2-epimerase (non-hydrolysing)